MGFTVYFAFAVVLVWLGLLVGYLWWAIHYYNVNLGLSATEWKVISPEIYASDEDRKGYETRRDAVAAASPAPADGADVSATNSSLLTAPTKNPYRRDSFGLPPGTIRGSLALTAMVFFVVVELVGLFNKDLATDRIDDARTVFEMVLAFYFGSRAVEVLQKATTAQKPATAPASVTAEAKPESAPIPAPAQQTASAQALPPARPAAPVPPPPATPPPPASAPPAAPLESPALSSEFHAERMVSLEPRAPEGDVLLVSDVKQADPLARRALVLTASFETGLASPQCFGVTAGNFDGQGLSFGVLQWNIGMGTLQPLLLAMREQAADAMNAALGDLFPELSKMLDSPHAKQMEWALSIQRTSLRANRTVWSLTTPWKQALVQLGTTPALIDLQVRQAHKRYTIALDSCAEYGLDRERGVALMFDINVQNGTVDRGGAGNRIRQDFGGLAASLSEDERQVKMMEIVARRRAEVAAAQWRGVVLARKLTIALGAGTVNGRAYDLAKQFQIAMAKCPEIPGAGLTA